jgi:hypothetical protein
MRKSPVKAKKAAATAASKNALKGFSAGERDLYREVRSINMTNTATQ